MDWAHQDPVALAAPRVLASTQWTDVSVTGIRLCICECSHLGKHKHKHLEVIAKGSIHINNAIIEPAKLLKAEKARDCRCCPLKQIPRHPQGQLWVAS